MSPFTARVGRPFSLRTLLALIVAGSFAGLSGCGKHGAPAPKGGSTLPPSKVALQRNVELAPVEQHSLVARVETVGVLEAEGQTEIAAGVSGVVDQVFFREGDEVQPGTLLATVDQVRFQADEQLAKANMERAKAALDLARDLADRAVRVGAGVSEEERSKALGGLKVAEAEYRSAIAAFARARNNLERSRVRAPYAGRINKRFITKGSYIEEKTPIATMADLSRIRLVGYVPETAAPLLREHLRQQDQRLEVARLGMTLACAGPVSSPWALGANLYLVTRDYVLSGHDPEFDLLALPGHVYHGRIFYMSTVANSDTHMFEAKAEVLGLALTAMKQTPVEATFPDLGQKPPAPTKDAPSAAQVTPLLVKEPPLPRPARDTHSEHKLWPGFTAKIRFPLKSTPNALVIPEEAVRASERGFIAFVPFKQLREDGKFEWIARARTLDLGFRADGWVEVRHGLLPSDWIVRRGAEALEDGTPIRFKDGPK